HAMTLLVVASPCALVLSIPSAILSAIAAGARQGILFKGGHAVETLAKVRCIALDKTGTLTTGNFRVTAVEASGHASVGECLQAAASLEAFSEHPLAMAIRHEAKNRNLPPLPVRNFTSHPGLGVEAEIDGAKCRVGQPALFEKLGISLPDLASAGEGTRVWIQSGGHFVRLTLTDEVRAESARAVGLLRKMGKRVVMLTGDHRAAAERVSREVGVDEVRADLQPQDKLEAIRELKGTHGSVAMVGDGVNDAPGMALSSIGIAMGARGSDAALEQADVILMNDRIGRLVEAVRLSERSLAVIKQNVAFSLGVVALLVTLAAFDEITLTLGVFGHEGSTVLVVLNSLRLLKKAD
ncbi:MAG: heavy metal translocating P-type ATPase, partial [Verrucomicrobiae bacterium]|nr:heavy metal translocating P-type ATPase [Verrucomicrobiae bacterium]